MARARSSIESEPKIERATFGPTPETVCNSSKVFLLSSSRKPKSVSESSRTIRDVCTMADAPKVSDALVAPVTRTE